MNKYIKLFLLMLFLITFSSCKNNEIKKGKDLDIGEIEYPTYSISEYNAMEKYTIRKTIDGIDYNYTYFFKDDLCVNAKEELIFKTNENAKAFYEENKSNEAFMEINKNNNKIIYYYNPEYFEYLMYPKDVLIELLNSNEFDE